MRMDKQAAIRQAIKLALLASICFLVSIHSISMANPLIKIDKGTKTHQYHVAHKPSSKVKSKRSSNTHSHPNHTDHPHHPHTQTARTSSGSKQARSKQRAVTKHQSAPQRLKTKSITRPNVVHQPTTPKVYRTTERGLTLVKTDHLQINSLVSKEVSPPIKNLLNSKNLPYQKVVFAAKPQLLDLTNPTALTEQKNYLQKKVPSSEIDPQIINQAINFINKYYPGIGQVIAQPILQLLPANPLLAKQWAGFSQSFLQNKTALQDKINGANNQSKNKDQHNKNVSKLHNTEKNKHKTQENKSDEDKDNEDNGHIKKLFPRHEGGWSPAYQRHMECVSNYKFYGGLTPHLLYDGTRIVIAARGGLKFYGQYAAEKLVYKTLAQNPFLAKSPFMKSVYKKAIQIIGLSVGKNIVNRLFDIQYRVENFFSRRGERIGKEKCKL